VRGRGGQQGTGRDIRDLEPQHHVAVRADQDDLADDPADLDQPGADGRRQGEGVSAEQQTGGGDPVRNGCPASASNGESN